MTDRNGGRLIALTLLITMVFLELVQFGIGLVALVLLVTLAGCAQAQATRSVRLPPPCVIEPAPPVPPGNTQRAAALYIERLYTWGATGWACVVAQQASGTGGGRDL